MRTIQITILLLSLFLASCTKEGTGIDEKNYYTKVQVQLAELPGTPTALEFRYNGEKLGALPSNESYYIPAGQPGKLAIYDKAGTLLADTVITPVKNVKETIKFAWSDTYGFKGWINQTAVSADSTIVQFLNNISTTDYPVVSPELHVCRYDPATGDVVDLLTLPGFTYGQLAQKITLPVRDADGNGIFYVGKLKDPVTGEFIINEGLGIDLFVISISAVDDGYPGVYWIGDVSANPADKNIQTTPIFL
jgi:hypothetical protein